MEKTVTPTIRITLRLPEDLHKNVEQMAVEDQRSLNGEIVHLLRQAVQKQKPENGTNESSS